MKYNPPLKDFEFLLNDFFNIEKYSNLPGFEEVSKDLVTAICDESSKFATDVILPLNRIGDKQGCKRDEKGNVTTPEGFKDAYKKYVENGWQQMNVPKEYGGQGLPNVLNYVVSESISSANMAFSMYPGLSRGAFEAIYESGSKEQKDKYLPKLASGEWSGTMNLTEPQCGTDLGLIKTKAKKNDDGSFSITGQKIWISAGEHDLSDNIIHLVLARTEDAPKGIKGISMFIVPKFLDDGKRNNLSCGGLEHKIGINGNATCVMDYDGATGFMVGEENKGMRAMFVMMNAARLAVGLQGLAQAQIAYDNALDFAKNRLQSRSLKGAKYPDLPADPIMVHPDVRRQLMDIKCFIEGGRAFLCWLNLLLDLSKSSESEKQKSSDLLNLLTPVAKSYLSEKGFYYCSQALQIYGGSGYTEEWSASQTFRDARITMIYEGTNAIQSLDLVGRKLMAENGRYWQVFFKEIDEFVKNNEANEKLKFITQPLMDVRKDLEKATMWLAQNAFTNPDHAGGTSQDYLNLFALTSFCFIWAKMAKFAFDNGGDFDKKDFYGQKIHLAQYFVTKHLGESKLLLQKITSGSDLMMNFPDEAF